MLFVACSNSALVDTFHTVNKAGWAYDEVFTDSVTISNPDYYHQNAINLRINGDYAYSNLWIKLKIASQSGKVREEKLNLQLAEKTGKWLGSGLGDVVTFQIPVLGKYNFKESGTHTITVEQYMRLEKLPNVESVGIKIEQLEEEIL